MLKIKSNTNEFTIIFSEKIRRKINAEKLSVQPSLFLLLFSSLVSAPSTSSFLSVFWSVTHFSFLLGVLPFIFQPKILFFSAQMFFSFSAQTFYSPKTLFFSPKRSCFSPKLFSIQPLFSSSFFCFILFWFSLSIFSAPFFVSFQLFSLRSNVLFSCFTSLLFE